MCVTKKYGTFTARFKRNLTGNIRITGKDGGVLKVRAERVDDLVQFGGDIKKFQERANQKRAKMIGGSQ